MARTAAARLLVAGALWIGLCGALPGLGQAQEEPRGVFLKSGDPAPSEGVFFSGPALAKLVEALRDRESWQAQVETLKATVHSLELALDNTHRENQDLRQAVEALKGAVAKAEWIDQNWDRIAGRYEAMLARQEKYAEQLAQRVHSLEQQRMWLLFSNPLIALIALLSGTFFR